MLTGWRKLDPPTKKMFPVSVDLPEFVCSQGYEKFASVRDNAAGDLTLIAFYYLLRAGEYTVKASREESKQTVQFRLKDVAFFHVDATGQVRQIDPRAPAAAFQGAMAATLRISQQKNGFKGSCIHHHGNGKSFLCPVKALVRRFLHIRDNTTDWNTFLSAYFDGSTRADVTARDISDRMKLAAVCLGYPSVRGIQVANISTHSLRAGGANALHLCGYLDREIQKMGRWRSDTFLEYILDKLHMFSAGMSKNMAKKVSFVNIEGGFARDITATLNALPHACAA